MTHLSFGCEPSALPLLSAAASLFKSESPDFSAALQRSLADGLPYPRARALAAEQLAGIPADLLAQPNAALALEYLQALPETLVPVPVARGEAVITTRPSPPCPAQPPSAQPWRGAA